MADASASSGSQRQVPVASSACAANDVADSRFQQDDQSSLTLELPRMSSLTCSFDGDDLVVDIVAELVEQSMMRSLEAFYERRLCGYASYCAVNAVFDIVLALLETPFAKCERTTHAKYESELEDNDPVMPVLCRPPSALVEPQPNTIDPFCFFGVPVRAPEPPTSQLYANYTIGTGTKLQHSGAGAGHASKCGDRRGSHSRPSSQSSSFRVRKAAPPPTVPVSPRSAAVAQAFSNSTTGQYHAPGVVYSTAPPPRVSPRKAMTLLKNAHRISAAAPINSENPGGLGGEEESVEATNESDVPLNDAAHAAAAPVGIGSKSGHRRDSHGYPAVRRLIGMHGEDGSEDDLGTLGRPLMEENAPVQVEFVIKQSGDRRRSSGIDKSAFHHPILPELSPQRRLSKRALPSGYPLNEPRHDNSSQLLSGPLDTSQEVESEQYYEYPASLHSPLKSLVLAPGVKLQNGEETKTGPELPLFPKRMRKATFYVRIHYFFIYFTERSCSHEKVTDIFFQIISW